MKDNANIIIFITHHANNQTLLDDVILNAMAPFDRFPESTLTGDEKGFINGISHNLSEKKLPGSTHNIEKQREAKLKRTDELAPVIDEIEEDSEKEDDPLYIEVMKSAKNIEIIGQILKNQYGSLKRPQLEELFEQGQNVGLRLLRSFIELMVEHRSEFEKQVQFTVINALSSKGVNSTQSEIDKDVQKILARFSYGVVFGWIQKIVDSLGYDKLIGVADIVNEKTNTAAASLINLSIHAWYKKTLDIDKIKKMHSEFDRENNYQAIYLLKDIVSRHIYMHPIEYQDKQRIDGLLGFSVKNQVSAQQKMKK